MKKLVAIVAVSVLLITGNISFALGTPPTDKPVKNVQVGQEDNGNKAKQAEIKTILQEIFADRLEILELKAEVHEAFVKAKSHVKELLQDRDNLTPEQLESLKEALQTIKEDRQSINNCVGDVAKEIRTLRLAKKNSNIDEMQNILDSINALQDTRIENLQNAIDDLNELAEL